MDSKHNPLGRQLAHLKVVSRLLGHELHSQGASKAISLSREQVIEIQTTLDLFIEEVSRRTGPMGSIAREASSLPTAGETHIVPIRN
jgi:hypothetical protein